MIKMTEKECLRRGHPLICLATFNNYRMIHPELTEEQICEECRKWHGVEPDIFENSCNNCCYHINGFDWCFNYNTEHKGVIPINDTCCCLYYINKYPKEND